MAESPSQPLTMNYYDLAEAKTLLTNLDNASSFVDLRVIGYSYDYKSNPSAPKGFPIYIVRISKDMTDDVEDNYLRNSILFECGMHPLEWLGSESSGTGVAALVRLSARWAMLEHIMELQH